MLDNVLNYIKDPLLKRAFLFIEEGDWVKANAYLEEVLNQNPEIGLAYLGKLMIDTQTHTCVELMDLAIPFDNNLNYKRCIRYSDKDLAAELSQYNVYIRERNDIVQTASIYNDALAAMESAKTVAQYEKIKGKFQQLGDYEDAVRLSQECADKIRQLECENGIKRAEKLCAVARDEADFIEAARIYEGIASQCDVKDKIDLCYSRAEKCKLDKIRREESKKARIKKAKSILWKVFIVSKYIISIVVVMIVLDAIFVTCRGYLDYKQYCEQEEFFSKNLSEDLQKIFDGAEQQEKETEGLLDVLKREILRAGIKDVSYESDKNELCSYRSSLYRLMMNNDAHGDIFILRLEDTSKRLEKKIFDIELMRMEIGKKIKEKGVDVSNMPVYVDVSECSNRSKIYYHYHTLSKKYEWLREDIRNHLSVMGKEKLYIEDLYRAVHNYNYKNEVTPDIWPVDNGWISAGFGKFDTDSAENSNDIKGWIYGDFGSDYNRFHPGLDIAVAEGEPVYATGSGKVVSACWKKGYGKYVEIEHDYGYSTAYGHMSVVRAKVGDYVVKGQFIGRVGHTGSAVDPHIHYEVIWRGERINPKSIIR